VEVVEALRSVTRDEAVSDTLKVSDTASLVDALALGVDAGTGRARLEPFV
jgi:hypothetical protein